MRGSFAIREKDVSVVPQYTRTRGKNEDILLLKIFATEILCNTSQFGKLLNIYAQIIKSEVLFSP
jgi:hypothetical protein